MNKILTIDQMKGMSIDDIVRLYREGYRIEEAAYPGVYEDENKIIPYSPRGKFGFMVHTSHTPETMSNKKILTAQNGLTISTGALLLVGIGAFLYLILKK